MVLEKRKQEMRTAEKTGWRGRARALHERAWSGSRYWPHTPARAMQISSGPAAGRVRERVCVGAYVCACACVCACLSLLSHECARACARVYARICACLRTHQIGTMALEEPAQSHFVAFSRLWTMPSVAAHSALMLSWHHRTDSSNHPCQSHDTAADTCTSETTEATGFSLRSAWHA